MSGRGLATPPDAGFSPRATMYEYNGDRQVTAITRPDGQAIEYDYEPSGRLDLVALPTGIIDVEYDGGGRVQSITAPGDVGHTFGWDGSLPLSVATTGPVPGSVIFTYDSDLRLASRTVNGSSSVSFGYDADGLLLSAGALSLARNTESGLLETTTLANTTDSRTRTSFGELDTWTGSVSGTPVYSFDLDRDAAGRITRKTETIGGVTSVWDYAYHPQRGWLTEVRKDSVVVATYGYDDNGNRTSWSDFWGSGTSTYDDQDRQLTADLVTYDYTANGERLTKTAGADVTEYLNDVRGALLSVDLPNGIAIEYVVDASGRRIGKKVDDVLTKGWIYAGGLSPVAQTDGTGAITQSYVYATKGNVPDYLVAGGTTYRIFTDHLGSVRLVVDATTGAIAQRIDYDAWGRITLDTNPGFQPFGFAGGLYDPQTGLVRFGARDYDPEVGRWTAKDPNGFGGGSQLLYEYCRSEPLNYVDPTGRYGQDVHLVRTFVWGLEEGVSIEENLAIATADQGMDRPIVDSPPNLHNPFNLPAWWLGLGTIEHFRPVEKIDRDLESAVRRNDATAFGQALHALQDSFSHRGFRWWSGGHVPHSLLMRLLGKPDTDEYNPESARDRAMEEVTRAWLWRWANRARDAESQLAPNDGVTVDWGVLYVRE